MIYKTQLWTQAECLIDIGLEMAEKYLTKLTNQEIIIDSKCKILNVEWPQVENAKAVKIELISMGYAFFITVGG